LRGGQSVGDALLDESNAPIPLTVTGHWTTGLEAGPDPETLNSAIRSPANRRSA
jgi:hypothetical protein